MKKILITTILATSVFATPVFATNLTSMGNNSDGSHTWRIRNSSNTVQKVKFYKVGSGSSTHLLVNPGEDFFVTGQQGTHKAEFKDKDGNTKTVTKASGTQTYNPPSNQGPQGEQGVAGEQGNIGPRGPRGYKGTFNQEQLARIESNTNRIEHLESDVRDNEKALAALGALAVLQQDPMGPFQVSAGLGYYKGDVGVAILAGGRLGDSNWYGNVGVSYSSDVTVSASLTYTFN